LHPVATHRGNPRGRERRVRDRVLVLMAGAHIDRTAVQRWEHRILSDAVARRYDAVARHATRPELAVTALLCLSL
jgi:chorismate mutase